MGAFLGVIGFLGLVSGIVLLIIGLVKKKRYWGWLISLLSIIIFIIGVAITPQDTTSGEDDKNKDEPLEVKENLTWAEKVTEVSNTDGSETEKADAIEKYARDYQPTEEEIIEFQKYIIQEYKEDNYIKNITNDEYMLGNIFKSFVVERYYKEGEIIKEFAFDFYQNSKYNYRRVETMISDFTLANEQQMNDALNELE